LPTIGKPGTAAWKEMEYLEGLVLHGKKWNILRV
jgi:hypothetical protein